MSTDPTFWLAHFRAHPGDTLAFIKGEGGVHVYRYDQAAVRRVGPCLGVFASMLHACVVTNGARVMALCEASVAWRQMRAKLSCADGKRQTRPTTLPSSTLGTLGSVTSRESSGTLSCADELTPQKAPARGEVNAARDSILP